MSMLQTIHTSYVPLRTAEVTAPESPLDGTTAGSNLWDMSTKDEFHLGEEANGIAIFFAGEMADGDQGTCHLYGRAKGGPAEKLAEVSLTAGTVFFEGKRPGDVTTQADNSSYMCIDTIALDATNEFHIRDIDFFDVANNRPTRMIMDLAGLEYILCEFSAVPGTRITPYGRVW